MTSKEVSNNIGKCVLSDKVCEVGVIKELIYIAGGDGRRSEYLVKVQYPTCEMNCILTSVRLTKKVAEPVQPVTKTTDRLTAAKHKHFLQYMRRLRFAGAKEMSSTNKETDSLEDAVSDVFACVFNRKPTAAELDYMCGGSDGKKCDRCNEYQKLEFHSDGSYGLTCKCTEALNKAFNSVL